MSDRETHLQELVPWILDSFGLWGMFEEIFLTIRNSSDCLWKP